MRLNVTKSKNSASLYVVKSIYNPKTQSNTSKIVEKLGTEAELREKLGGVPPVGTYKAIISFAALTGRRAGEIGPQVIDLVPVAN